MKTVSMTWIDVNQSLPNSSRLVLGCMFWEFDNTKTIDIVYYDHDEGSWFDTYEVTNRVNVTHWATLIFPDGSDHYECSLDN